MSLFSRKSRRTEADSSPDVEEVEGQDVQDDVDGEDVAEGPGGSSDEGAADDGASWTGSGLSDRSAGPWDVSEVEETEGYVDLGALRVKGRDGMELRLELEESSGRVTSATVQLAGSAVQLQVFAAPRSSGIWDEIRKEIAAGITKQGGTVDDVPGTFGRELLAQLPARTPDGKVGVQPVRFTGVDGPRWFLRAVFHGAAAFDHEQAEGLEGVVRDVVVVRGPDAMAPRELLALRLPETGPEQAAEQDPAREPIEPFRRGPEITETR